MAEVLERLRAALAGRYQIEREIGRGGMASVYLAQDLKHNRPVALKVLHPDLAARLGTERFLREIRIAAQLNHPHILTLIDSGEAQGFLYYVMPHVSGESLRQKLDRQKELSLEEALRITKQVAAALEYAHGQKVIHRDIKPQNVLFHEGEAMVADFGIALAVTVAGGERLTETGLSLGTPEYMSPEQSSGERELDGRSDIYSLACVLYEMLAGEPPYTGPTAQAVIAKRFSDPVPSVRRLREVVPAHLDAALIKALAKVPPDRFAAATEFAAALAAPVPTPAPARPRSWRYAALAVMAAALVAGSLWVFKRFTAPAAGGGAPPRIESLAVLPLDNLSGDPEQEYFSDGMTEELIGELAQLGGLRVISRTSIMRYKGTTKSMPQIAQELKVDGIVEGSVQRAGERVRIRAQLIHAPSDRHLWAESYEGDLRDVLALQREVAQAVAREIRVAVAPSREVPVRPVNPEVYSLYLKGRYWLQKLTEEGFARAPEYFNQAIAIDSTFAPAYAWLAWSHVTTAEWFSPPWEWAPKARAAAMKAVELDETLAEGHVALGWVYDGYDWDWAAAEQEFQRALELNPSLALAYEGYGWYLIFMGRFDEAVAQLKRGLELDPLSALGNQWLGAAHLLAGRHEQAIDQFRKALELQDDFSVRQWLGSGYVQMGQFVEAVREYQKARELADIPVTAAWLAYGYALAGRGSEARKLAQELEQLARQRYVPPTGIARVYAALGEKDQALAWLEKGYQLRSGWMFSLKVWPTFDGLRSDPRFQDLMRRMKFPE